MNERNFSRIAELIGEKSRAIMLWNLLEGKAFTATELADCAGISRQTCSTHLSLLVEGSLLTFSKQGRHKYYRLANESVARVIENLACLVTQDRPRDLRHSADYDGFRYARTCYDHLAGRVAVQIADFMVSRKIIVASSNEYEVTHVGEDWFDKLSVDIDEVRQMKRKFAYPCLDWSERKNHLGGALGAAVLKCFLSSNWIRKKENTREVAVTARGKIELYDRFNIGR